MSSALAVSPVKLILRRFALILILKNWPLLTFNSFSGSPDEPRHNHIQRQTQRHVSLSNPPSTKLTICSCLPKNGLSHSTPLTIPNLFRSS
jgi:hypothetical protein